MVTGWVNDGYAATTIHTAWSYVVSVLREARLDGLLHGDPTEGVRLPQKPRAKVVPLTDAQVITLMGVMPDALRRPRGGLLTRGRRSEAWARYRSAIGGETGEGRR